MKIASVCKLFPKQKMPINIFASCQNCENLGLKAEHNNGCINFYGSFGDEIVLTTEETTKFVCRNWNPEMKTFQNEMIQLFREEMNRK